MSASTVIGSVGSVPAERTELPASGHLAAGPGPNVSVAAPATTPPAFSLWQAWQTEMQRAFLQSMKTMDVLMARDAVRVGQTPKEVVWQQGTAQLYHYRATTPAVHPVPLLVVHSLVSKPYILDLIPGNSFIAYLLDQGLDVYLLDWGTPRPEDWRLQLEDYVLGMLPAALDVMLAESGASEFSLFGYCLGGVLALLYAATHPTAPLRNLITLATPVDFQQMGLNTVWTDPAHFDVDRLVETFGNVPAALIHQAFRMLKPASEVSPVKYLALWQNVLNDQYVAQYRAFDQWTNDHIPFAGACFRQTTKELLQQNKLAQGTLALGGRSAALSNIRCSFLAIAAESDHIVPLAATKAQPDLVSSTDKELLVLPGGHVGLAAGRKAVQTLWPTVATWLTARSQIVDDTEAEAPIETAAPPVAERELVAA